MSTSIVNLHKFTWEFKSSGEKYTSTVWAGRLIDNIPWSQFYQFCSKLYLHKYISLEVSWCHLWLFCHRRNTRDRRHKSSTRNILLWILPCGDQIIVWFWREICFCFWSFFKKNKKGLNFNILANSRFHIFFY